MTTATFTPPPRSLTQRRTALEHANEVRMKRAQLKRDLKSGEATITDVLARPPEWLLTARVPDVLRAVPKLGRVKVDKILRDAGVSPRKSVKGLSHIQRAKLVERLRR